MVNKDICFFKSNYRVFDDGPPDKEQHVHLVLLLFWYLFECIWSQLNIYNSLHSEHNLKVKSNVGKVFISNVCHETSGKLFCNGSRFYFLPAAAVNHKFFDEK